jgi:hypothetical protein
MRGQVCRARSDALVHPAAPGPVSGACWSRACSDVGRRQMRRPSGTRWLSRTATGSRSPICLARGARSQFVKASSKSGCDPITQVWELDPPHNYLSRRPPSQHLMRYRSVVAVGEGVVAHDVDSRRPGRRGVQWAGQPRAPAINGDRLNAPFSPATAVGPVRKTRHWRTVRATMQS